MKVMTFGANCSPCIAQFIKNFNAAKFKEGYPESTKFHYVDDWVQSCRTVEEATTLIQQVVDIQEHAGFRLHKWASNSNELLKEIGKQGQNTKTISINTKALGINWNTDRDVYTFNITKIIQEMLNHKNLTKKDIASYIGRLFDPLGFI